MKVRPDRTKQINILVLSLLILTDLNRRAISKCINGKENGESWPLKPCKTCYCINDKIVCNVLCRRRNPTEFIQQQGSTVVEKRKQSEISHRHHSCKHDNIEHQHNETWHETGAHVSSLDLTKECMQCHCHRNIVMCTIRKCKRITCSNPVTREGSCCLACTDDVKEKLQSNVCVASGSIFSELSTWRMYVPFKENRVQCLDCTCKKGGDGALHKVCPKHKCPQLMCSEKIGKPGQCCAVCKDGTSDVMNSTTKKNQDGGFYIDLNMLKQDNSHQKQIGKNNDKKDVVVIKKGEKDCAFDGVVYKHDEHFIPNIDRCLRCHCQNTNVKCSKILCRAPGNCQRTEMRPGLCCHVCPDVSTAEARIQEQNSIVSITKKNDGGCSRKRDNQIRVYEHLSKSEDSSTLRSLYLFDLSAIGKTLEMHSWVLEGDQTEVVISEVLDARLLSNWKYLGSIKKKVFNRIIRHEEELKSIRGRILCIQKIYWLQKLIKEKTSKRKRYCKSAAISIINFKTRDVFKSLKEIG